MSVKETESAHGVSRKTLWRNENHGEEKAKKEENTICRKDSHKSAPLPTGFCAFVRCMSK